jgi:hypothetical protein
MKGRASGRPHAGEVVLGRISALVALAASLWAAQAVAATVMETTEVVADTAQAAALLPDAMTFTVTTAGSHTITLQDLQTPVALESLRAIVTHGLEVVANVSVASPASSATADFNAVAGTYRVHVLGLPEVDEAAGAFAVKVEPTAGGAAVLSQGDVIVAEPEPSTGKSVSRIALDLAAAGTYQLTLTDLSFAPTVTTLQALVLQETSGGPVVVPVTAGAFNAPAAGAYELLVEATTSGGELAGLYSVQVAGPGATVVHRSVRPGGRMTESLDISLAAAGQHTLSIADANFPAALTFVAAAVAQNGTVLAQRSGDGSATFTAAQGNAQLFALATPSVAEGIGAFGLSVSQGAQVAYADVRAVDASADPATPAIYFANSTGALAAGNYTLALTDFAFPMTLSSLQAAVTQNAGVVQKLTAAGATNVALQAAPVKILIAAKPPAGGGNGLFNARLTPSPGTNAILETTQGVGGLFRTHPVQIDSAGQYDLALADLEFPARLRSASLAVTNGGTLAAQIFGKGTIQKQQLAAGTYVLSFIGQPASDADFGAYGLSVANTPSPPTLTLSASPATITSGQTTSLQWTATNATTCTASGGWSGTKATTGPETVGPLNANATFELKCDGPGGSVTASTTVTVNAAGANRRGGGGAMNLWLLAGLAALMFTARQRQLSSRARSSA